MAGNNVEGLFVVHDLDAKGGMMAREMMRGRTGAGHGMEEPAGERSPGGARYRGFSMGEMSSGGGGGGGGGSALGRGIGLLAGLGL